MNRSAEPAMTESPIGVSPAYFISRFGDRFTADQVADGLETVAAMGYGGFQPEVFHRTSLGDWRKGGGARVAARADALGLRASQFVAHFLLHTFRHPDPLAGEALRDDLEAVMEIVSHFDGCRIITVPVGPGDAAAPRGKTADRISQLRDLVGIMAETMAAAGCRLALELLPGSIVGGIEGFQRLSRDLGPDRIGLNFDTGHAWASDEDLLRIPQRLGRQILGTHLCDNFGRESLSLGPGQGTIDWHRLVPALQAAGYGGAWDIEIICPPEDCCTEYEQACAFIASRLQPSTAGTPGR